MTSTSRSNDTAEGTGQDLSGPDPVIPDPTEIVAAVVILGELESVRWERTGVQAQPEVLSRLSRTGLDLDDPVGFLTAVRSAFGDDVAVTVTDPN